MRLIDVVHVLADQRCISFQPVPQAHVSDEEAHSYDYRGYADHEEKWPDPTERDLTLGR